MPTPIDLSEVIQTAVDDVHVDETLTNEETEESSFRGYNDAPEETPEEGVEAPAEAQEATEETEVGGSPTPNQDGPQFALDKKLGIPSHTNGRENRIPYSRVKKIVEGAEKRALEPLQKQLAELTPKIQEYEQRLTQVAEFEQVMVNDPGRFLDMLSTIPAYSQFFQMMEQFVSNQNQAPAQQTPEAQAAAILENDPMPQPDDEDGTGYTMEGLKKLLDWNARVVKSQVTQEIESQYKPIKERFDAEQTIAQLTPKVQKQMEAAYQWPKFAENEAEIIQVLQQYPTASLEQAYQHVVVPKLIADEQKLRTDIRQQVLGELKKAPPVSTGVPAGHVKPRPASVSSGPRNLEDVIAEQLKENGYR